MSRLNLQVNPIQTNNIFAKNSQFLFQQNFLQEFCEIKMTKFIRFFISRGWWWKGGGMVQFFFWNLTLFFYIHFKNTSNLIFPSFKVPYERFFHKDFKTGLTLQYMWFSK